jgi:hypothetical protein
MSEPDKDRLRAALEALSTLLVVQDSDTTCSVRICTDSQSAVRRLSLGPAAQNDRLADDVWRRIVDVNGSFDVSLAFQWVPSHCGIDGNEAADGLAGLGTVMPQEAVRISARSISNALNRFIVARYLAGSCRPPRLPPRSNYDQHWALVGDKWPKRPHESGLKRRECTAITRLRVGRSNLTNIYLNMINPEAHPSPICDDCKIDVDTSWHLFECPKWHHLRIELFASVSPTMSDILDDLKGAAEYIRRTGRLKNRPRV